MIDFIYKPIVRRLAVFIAFGLLLYLLRDLLNLFLLTFIFTFLFYSAQNFIFEKSKRFVKIHQKLIISSLYLLIITIVGFILYNYVPAMIKESTSIIELGRDFLQKSQKTEIEKYISTYITNFDIKGYIGENMGAFASSLTNIGKWGFNIIVSFVLSLYFLLEKNKVIRFVERIQTSKLSFFYDELKYFGQKFTHSFGKVIQAQITIAFCNSILSTIALSFMGFPKVLGLGVMIFFLGLIPVAGAFISLVPLSVIALTMPGGGLKDIIYVIAMIAVLHALENYLLNPKLVSAKIELPVFFTFMVLITSEHFLGIWGLIIGIPIFMFILDILEIKSVIIKGENKVDKKLK